MLISPHNHERIYYGSQILFASDDRGNNWEAISPDLSRNLDRNKLKVMGRVWGPDAVAKNMSTSQYGTIVSVSESPLVEGLIYVGTDDGMVQVTEDGGENWRGVSEFGSLSIPEYGYINDIEADLHDEDTVYVAVNNHKRGDFKPYVVKSTDRGKTWSNITSDLPERGSAYALKQDHENANLLFCGTEFGCFTSVDGGEKWIQLRSGLPPVAIRDIEIQQAENDLVLASFGRGFFVLDDYTPLRNVDEALLKKDAIMPIRKGLMFPLAAPLAGGNRAFQGANFYTAPNPAYGVAITYHLQDSLKTKKSERVSKDKKLDGAGKDIVYPSWDEFKAEDREVAPRVDLNIRNSEGELVRRINGSTSRGMHRTNWDLRMGGSRRGPMAIPGTYTVDITKTIDGETTELVAAADFEIEPLMYDETSQPDREAIMEFVTKAQDLSKSIQGATSVAGQAQTTLTAIKSVVSRSVELDQELFNEARTIELKLMDILEKFNGDPTKPKRNEPALPGISGRVRTMMFGAMGSTEGPTGTHERQFEIAAEQYEAVLGELETLVDDEIPALNEKLDEADAPWTPGRKIPSLK